MLPQREIYTEEHHLFRDMVRRFMATEITPNIERWEEAGIVDREAWTKAGEQGLLCPTVPEEYGGVGGDFRFNAIVTEELAYAGVMFPSYGLHSDIVVDYILHYGSPEQKRYWLPRMVSGEKISAIGMTEPNTGSDLQGIQTRARREGDEYVINGAKTFISNGQIADFVVVVCKTADDRGSRNFSLIIVESGTPGFRRGRNLKKMGQKGADTSELFFEDVRVPVSNRLGEEGEGMACLMRELPQERLSVSFSAIATAQLAYDLALAYVRERKAFGKPIIEFQNTQFKLAECKTELTVGWHFIDSCLARHLKGAFTATDGAIAKLWLTEMQGRVIDSCLQMFGGYGYMEEYPISRLYTDARVQRIYGGTSEIMKVLISRNL